MAQGLGFDLSFVCTESMQLKASVEKEPSLDVESREVTEGERSVQVTSCTNEFRSARFILKEFFF